MTGYGSGLGPEAARCVSEAGAMDRIEHFWGRLLAGDQVLLERVEGQLKTHIEPKKPNSDWSGHIDLTAGQREKLTSGQRYRLVLIDGRSGFVNVFLRDTDEEGRCVAMFRGLGSFRR